MPTHTAVSILFFALFETKKSPDWPGDFFHPHSRDIFSLDRFEKKR